MQLAKTIQQIRGIRDDLKIRGREIALVPTMGALHEGHVALMQKAHQHADAVFVSIFVNPTQFGPSEDYKTYPRNIDQDLEICKKENVTAVFAPETNEIYNIKPLISFSLELLGDHLCGASRPGHFNGVIQVVNKFLNIIQPDYAIFGQKDIQQYTILNRMIHEFNHSTKLIMAETQRDTDGLALSSRNLYLTDEERSRAPMLFRTLQACASHIKGNPTQVTESIEQAKSQLEEKGFKIDYISLVDDEYLQPITDVSKNRTVVLAAAAYLGKTRLIDNIIITD